MPANPEPSKSKDDGSGTLEELAPQIDTWEIEPALGQNPLRLMVSVPFQVLKLKK